MVGAKAFAYDVAVENEDGKTIYYNYINNSTELEVTYSYSYRYSGDIKIPETVTILNKTRKVTSIDKDAFYDCSGLTSVTIPSSVTSIGNSAFFCCSGLTSITIPSSVTSIGSYAFEGCSGLKKVVVKDLAAWYGISFGSYYSNPLSCAKHLYSDEDTEITDLVIPEDVTSINSYTFSGCSGLTSVTIPSSVASIDQDAFYGCSGLTSVTIPSSVASIDQGAFYGCSGLTSVTIPASVTSIGSYAFDYCNNLADFVSLIEEPFGVDYIVSDLVYNNGTLYVPEGTIEKYKATDGWKQFLWIEEGVPMSIKQPNANGADAKETQRYTIGGDIINNPQRGINIVKMSDGTVKKVIVK
ncbi:MAG: leucine-rich repeat domain-containing protein [Prevotella sp.]|nr:leucine-rich repeat domain-containing protein [Prevotella sp.]